VGNRTRILEQLRGIRRNYLHVLAQMGDAGVAADASRYGKLARQHHELEPVVEALERYERKEADLVECRALLAEGGLDEEFRSWTSSELSRLEGELAADFLSLQRLLLPKDPLDGKNVVLEIRAGTGGEEAALFAAEMFRGYCRYAEGHGWRVESTHLAETGLGGLKEVTAVVEGKDVYSRLKFESGTHRVQRVPETEAQGRVHTSAITVAILAEAEEVEVQVEEKDLRIDTFRSSGAGGQHVNTTDSAVRITHLPSGVVVSCQDEKSQIKNRDKAMRILRSHLYERKIQEQNDKIAADRKAQVGSGDRSEKIRTYNFPQGRVTDHRIKYTLYRLDAFMNGEMDEMIDACRTFFETQKIQAQFGSQES